MTEDGGYNWQAVEMDGDSSYGATFKNHAVYAVEMAPSDHHVIWVAHDFWVAKSTDGGKTWSHIQISDSYVYARVCISLAIDPSDPGTVYVGTSGIDGVHLDGALYKTRDGGETWEIMAQWFDYTVRDIDIDPQNSSTIWAVTNSDGASEGWDGTLYYSDDSGATWYEVFSFGSYHAVAVKPGDSNTVFTASRFGVDMVYDDGDTWHLFGLTSESAYALAFDPQNQETLYASSAGSVGRSNDGGSTWEIHENDYIFRSLAVHPTNRDLIFGGELTLGLFKGMHQSQDGSYTWTPMNHGINAVIVYDVAADPSDPKHLLAATVLGIYERKAGGPWGNIMNDPAFSVLFHPTDSRTFYAGLQGSLAKTVNEGADWAYSDWLEASDPRHFNFVEDIAVHPDDSGRAFIAVAGAEGDYGEIYRSTDGGDSFDRVLEGVNLSGQGYGFNVLAIDPSNPQHILAGGGNSHTPVVKGDLWESTNGGTDWNRTSLRHAIVNALLIDPRHQNIMYAGCGAAGGTDVPVYTSTDGGSTWTPHHEGIPGPLSRVTALWGSSSADVFVVGVDGHVFRYDGRNWNVMRTPTIGVLWGVWGASTEDVFAVGEGLGIYRYDGSDWVQMHGPDPSRDIYSVWGVSGTQVFAVGDSGTILHYDGGEWATMASPTGEDLMGVWGASDADVFAVGDFGVILHYDGNTWSEMESGTAEWLSGVWGTSRADVIAVGASGTILHYDGSVWDRMGTPTTENLWVVWGASRTDVFAVGNSSTILHYDGTTWVRMGNPATEDIFGVWGASGTDVFAAVGDGTVLHYNGSSWTVAKPLGAPFNSVMDLAFHPQNQDVVYAGTSLQGVYASPNQGRGWGSLGTTEYRLYAISTGSLYAATQGGLLQCTGTGILSGKVVDASTGGGIHMANVVIHPGGIDTNSVNGEYLLSAPAGIHDATASAVGYASRITEGIAIYGGDVVFEDFNLESEDPSGKGDLDGDGKVDLRDVLIGLQVLAGMVSPHTVSQNGDANGDQRIGLEEVVYALRATAGGIEH